MGVPMTTRVRLLPEYSLYIADLRFFAIERLCSMMKVRQKTSGCFRTEAGVAVFCDLRSYLSTMHKQGVHLLTALRSAVIGSPLLPPLLAA